MPPPITVRDVVGATVVGVLRARTLVFSEAGALLIWTVGVVPTRRVADALAPGDDPVALESAFAPAATESGKLVVTGPLVALEVATASVVAKGRPFSVAAGERPTYPDPPFPRPGCEPVVPTAVNAPLRIETVWTTFEGGCRLVVPGKACDLTVPHATAATHSAAARGTSPFRFGVLVTGTHFQKLTLAARSLRSP